MSVQPDSVAGEPSQHVTFNIKSNSNNNNNDDNHNVCQPGLGASGASLSLPTMPRHCVLSAIGVKAEGICACRSAAHLGVSSPILLQAAELESAVAERTQNVVSAETTLKLKELEFERRATALEKEHAAKMASVLQQMRLLRDQDSRQEEAEASQADQRNSRQKEPEAGQADQRSSRRSEAEESLVHRQEEERMSPASAVAQQHGESQSETGTIQAGETALHMPSGKCLMWCSHVT